MQHILRSVLIISLAIATHPALCFAQTATPSPQTTASPTSEVVQPYDGKWHGSLTPYIWAPGASGTIVLHHPTLAAAVTGESSLTFDFAPSSVFSVLNSAGMLAAEARKDAFSIFGDYIFVNISSSKGGVTTITGPGGIVEVPVTSSTSSQVNGTIWSLASGVTVAHGAMGSLDVFAGVRSAVIRAGASWSFTGPLTLVPLVGDASDRVSLTDFIAGIRGKIALGHYGWYIPYYGDAGSGSDNSTWQALGGFGYAKPWGNILLVYRALGYNQGDDFLARRLTLSGLAVGYTFKF